MGFQTNIHITGGGTTNSTQPDILNLHQHNARPTRWVPSRDRRPPHPAQEELVFMVTSCSNGV